MCKGNNWRVMKPKKDKEKSKAKRPVGAPLLYTPEVIEEIAKDLNAWSRDDTSYFLREFTSAHRKYNLVSSDMSEFAAKNEKFKATLARVKDRILARIYVKACKKEFDGSFVARILPLIDQEYKAWRQSELQIEQEVKDRMFKLFIHPDRLKKVKEAKDEIKK